MGAARLVSTPLTLETRRRSRYMSVAAPLCGHCAKPFEERWRQPVDGAGNARTSAPLSGKVLSSYTPCPFR